MTNATGDEGRVMPFRAIGEIATTRAGRYFDQLSEHLEQLQHLGHRRHGAGPLMPSVRSISRVDTRATIEFDIGSLILTRSPDALTISAQASDWDALERLKQLITHRVATIGHRDGLTVCWQEQG